MPPFLTYFLWTAVVVSCCCHFPSTTIACAIFWFAYLNACRLVVVQKMLLFEGCGFVIFQNKRRQRTNWHKPRGAWGFIILDPLLFWVGGLQGGYPLWEGPAGTFCKSCSTENASFWRFWFWDFLAKRRETEQSDKAPENVWRFIILGWRPSRGVPFVRASSRHFL